MCVWPPDGPLVGAPSPPLQRDKALEAPVLPSAESTQPTGAIVWTVGPLDYIGGAAPALAQ